MKPENLLLESSEDLHSIKLIDFGTAQRFHPGQILTDTIGTAYYIAPEVLNGSYSKECDIWSIGVISYILLSGSPPFRGKSDLEILKSIQEGKVTFDQPVWKQISPTAINFIVSCLTKEANQRVTAEQLLKHQFIQDHSIIKVDDLQAKSTLDNLIKFHTGNTLKAATLSFIGSQLISKRE